MKYAALNDTTFALRLDRGDDIHATIQNFCAEHTITNAAVTGLGSVENPKLAHYSIETRAFTDKSFTGIYEITTLAGNLALVEGKPFAHLHVTISDPDMRAWGGHLVQGTCSATLELIVTAYPTSHAKSHQEAVGLNVWDF